VPRVGGQCAYAGYGADIWRTCHFDIRFARRFVEIRGGRARG
jgi:hypothetical protein